MEIERGIESGRVGWIEGRMEIESGRVGGIGIESVREGEKEG